MKIRLTPPLALLLLLCGPLAAQTLPEEEEGPPWYQVELFVFAQPGQPLYDEYWDDRVQPTPSADAIALIGNALAEAEPVAEAGAEPVAARPPDDPAYARGAFALLPPDQWALPLDPAQLARRGYRPLFHGAWRQPMLERERSRPIRIQGGARLANGQPELGGVIQLDIARYLHLRTDLYFTQPLPDNWVSPRPAAPASTAAPSLLPYPALSELPLLTPESATRYLSVNLKQGRRMRSNELHYLDHPMFGLFIKITPWEAPEPEARLQPAENAPEPPIPALPIPVAAPTISASPQ